MIISKLHIKGINHLNYNEDSLYVNRNVKGYVVATVMDGCSTAKDSHWCAMLIGKLIHQHCKKINETLIDNINIETLGKEILKNVFNGLKDVKKLLNLDEIELFSTLLICIINPLKKEYWINASGDGLFMIDNSLNIINQSNTPDFLAYHIDIKFNNWFLNHTQFWQGTFEKKILISTDGIEKMNDEFKTKAHDWILKNGLLQVMSSSLNPNSLSRKYQELRKKEYLFPFDDLAVIAIEV